MHLSPGNMIRASIKSPFTKAVAVSADVQTDEEHQYIKGDPACRGPCPGLNALCNQGYLPRDSKNLTVPLVEHALMAALHISKAAAKSLTISLPPLLLNDGTFDLVDTRRRGVIEQDASFTRLDFHQGDNYTFQPQMLEAMIQDAEGGDVTLRTLVKTFIRRNRESRAAGALRLGLKLWLIGVLQAVGVMNTAQTGGKLTREVLEAVFAEERFPPVILDNPKPGTVFTLLGNVISMLWWTVTDL